MTIFLSWSGDQSRAVARILADWIPDVLVGVQTWMSDHDIQAGSRWAEELGAQLERCQFGIACLTPENTHSPWILFEAGALSMAIGRPKVVPYLFKVTPANVEFPLAQFQSVDASYQGTFKLIESINSIRENKLDAVRLERVFKRSYPELSESLAKIPATRVQPGRTDRELLEEIVGLLRATSKAAVSAGDPHHDVLPAKPFAWEAGDGILKVSGSDLAAMDERELAHYRRQLHIRFRRTDSRDEEEALERQQRLAEREYRLRQGPVIDRTSADAQ